MTVSRWPNPVALAVLVGLLFLADRGLDRLDGAMITKRSGGWDGAVVLDFATELPASRPPVGASVAEPDPMSDSAMPAPSGVRNVLLIVGDGMGFGQVALARNELVGPNRRLAMEQASAVGWVSTHGPARLYTDSAATATALATGFKTNRGAVGVDASGVARLSLAEAARDVGRSVGLVTDSYLWDATPGAFGAHVAARTEYEEIARQLTESGFDLLVGGSSAGKGDYRELFRTAGWRVFDQVEPWREAVLAGETTVGFFDALPLPRGPTLTEIAQVAVERLEGNPLGFFLLVECEETDTGSHQGDFPRLIEGMRSLDAVAEWAFDYADRMGDTLVVVTADHDTGAPVVLDGRVGEPQAVRWSSPYHTAQPVPLFAHGPGAERLAGVFDNREIAPILAELAGLTLETESPREASGRDGHP